VKPQKGLPLLLLIACIAIATRTHAQKSEIGDLFHDLETMDAGTQAVFDKADPVLKRLVQSNEENVAHTLPVILQAASDPHLSVRRVAAMALYQIAGRSDGRTLLSTETTTFSELLVDPDIPIRRITGIALEGLRLDASSPLVPVLESYLAREDAVSTIGAGVVGLLMQAAPDDAASTNAIVQFMRRKDQTPASRSSLLISIRVAKSRSLEISKEVAAYATDSDEPTSVDAIETLQGMGRSAILDNQQALSRIAADTSRTPRVRAAATKALSAIR
jgi:hypothetical protein